MANNSKKTEENVLAHGVLKC